MVEVPENLTESMFSIPYFRPLRFHLQGEYLGIAIGENKKADKNKIPESLKLNWVS